MKNIRTFVAGLIVGTILLSTVTVFAGTQTIEAFYNNIKISIEGKAIELKDAAGDPIEPFIHEGTTYLPIRAIAEALGMEVKYNETTNTVELTKAKEVGTVNQRGVAVSNNDYTIVKENEYLDVQVMSDGTKYIYPHSYILYLNKKVAREYLLKWNNEYPELSKASRVITETDETNSTIDFILLHYNGQKIVLMQDVPIVKMDIDLLPYDEYMNNILPQLLEAIKKNQ